MTVSFRSFLALRRNILLTLCLVSALMFSVFPVQAQPLWTAVNAGLFDNASENVPVYCVGANGPTIFASIGSPAGQYNTKLYRSLDNGNSWSQLTGAPASIQFVGFYFQGTTVFAISSFSTLFRSVDNGISWQEIDFRGNGMLSRAAAPNLRTAVATAPYGIVFDGTASTIFVAVSNGVGVVRSSDNGTTWQNVSTNLPRSGSPPYDYVDMQVTDINVQGSTIFLSSSNKGVFRSTNNGDTWTNIGLTNEQIYSITSSGGIVLAHTINGKVYRSTNSGSSWQLAITLGDAFGSVPSGGKLVYGQGTVFAATIGAGIWYSTDDGVAWKRIPDYYVTPLRNATSSFTASANSIFASTINYIPVQANETGVLRMNNYSSLPSTTPPLSIFGTIQNNVSASLALSGTATNSTTASATGAYSFSGLANGAYTVTPTLTGYVFVPSSTSVTISGTSLSGVNFQAFTAPPPAPATVLTFSSVGASSATLTWNPPAGGAQNYIVVVRAGGAPSYSPQNGTSPTGVNSNFTLASPLADGSRIVYDGSGTSVSLTGLSPQTSYTVVIFPSNGSGAMRSYQINAPLTGTQSTSALPQLQITPASLDFGSVTVGTVSTGSLTISGTSLLAAVNVTAAHPALSLSLTNTPFTTQAVLSLTPTNGAVGATQIFVRFSPSVIGAYTSTLTVSSLNATSAVVTVNGAGIQNQNQYSIFGSIGIANGVLTLGGTATQSTSASSVGAYSFSTLANGVYTVTPTLTGYIFTPSSTSVTIGGASAYGVNFQPFAVPPSAAATTLVFSSVNASSATIAWNPPVGGAQSYIVVVRPNGTPSYSPANGITPTGVNSDITLANALADGSRVVYDGSGTSLLLTGLSPQTNYTVIVFPSNGANAVRSYQTVAPLTSSFVTLPPSRITLTPSALNFGSVTLGTVSTASFSVNGDGLTQALVLTSSGASFSLSLTGSPFTTQASLSLVPVSNTILPTTVFVRFTPSTTGASVGGVLASGASTATLTLNGTGTTPIPPPVLKAAYAGVRTPIDVTDLQAFTVTFRNAANALVDYPGVGGNVVHFRGGTPLGASTGTLTLTRLSLGTYQASSVFTGTGSYTLSLVGVTSTSGTRTFTVQASVNNPTPTLSSIAPATTTATTNTWTLTLNGSNFLPESRVIVGGVPLDQQNVSFVSGALLKAQVVQPLAGVYSVVVENPTPGGGTSAPRTLTVNNPAPRLAAIEPVSVVAGQDAVLTLYGGYFTTATVVRFQNGAVTTTLAVLSLLSPTMATVTIPGSLITISGTYQIRAFTPVLGGGTSAAENLLVRGAAAVSSEFVNVTTSVVSGTNLNAFTVRFRDTFGNLTNIASPVLGYGESTGATTGTIRLKYASTGVSTATATRMDIGGTYSLWINGIGTTTGSRSYTVTGGNDARVTFSGVPVSVTAGTVVPAFALRFEDAAGNLTDNGVGRLTYTRTGGSSTATLALTRLSTGMYTAQSTVCTIAGAYNLAVSSVTPANTFGTKAFTLTPSSFVTVDFVISTSAMTTRGGSISVTANLFDAFGNRTDNLGGYDSLAVIVTNAEFPSSTATVAFARQSLGVYKAQVPVLLPGPYQSKLGGWKKGSELTGDPIIDTLLEILDRFLRESYDVSLSPGLAVRADFVNVPTRLYVADTFSPEVDQATVTLRDVRGTRTHLWGGTVGLTINNVPRGTLGTTSNTFSLAELTTTANLAVQLADYGKLYFNPFVVSTLGTYAMALNSTNGTAITTYTGNRTFTVQQPPARLTLTSATLDFGSQFVLAPVTRAYTLRYDDITTNTIVVSPSNHPAFLTSVSENGVFTTTESIILTVGGTQPAPASGTATFWVRFLPVQGGNASVNLNHTSTLASGITAATVRLTLRGAGLMPDVKIVLGTTNLTTIPFGQVALGDTRYFGYTMTYRNITASTISVSVPAGNDFAIAQVSSGTWTTAGQTLTLPTVQPATSATTQVQLWVRFTPTIAQATTVTLTHLADGGDPRTMASDMLVLTAKKPSVLLETLPKTWDLGTMQVGNSTSQTVMLTYQNVASSIIITPPQNTEIQINGEPFSSNPITFTPPSPTGQASIVVRYTPVATGVINGTVKIVTSIGTSTTQATVVLTGNAKQFLTLIPNVANQNFLVLGGGATLKFTLNYQSIIAPITIDPIPGTVMVVYDYFAGLGDARDIVWSTTAIVIAPTPNSNTVAIDIVIAGKTEFSSSILKVRSGNYTAQSIIALSPVSPPICSSDSPIIDPYFYHYFPNAPDNKVIVPAQWHLCHPYLENASIQAVKAWGIFAGSTSSIITICDDGLNPNHPEFAGKVARQFVRPGNEYYQDNHGTAAAGIAAAKADGKGIVGVDPNARLIPLFSYGEREIASLYFSSDPDPYARVSNHSYGLSGYKSFLTGNYVSGYFTVPSKDFANAYMNNKIVCAAVGNFGDGNVNVHYPARFRTSVTVGMTEGREGKRVSGSQIGSHLDVVAPGENLLTTLADDRKRFHFLAPDPSLLVTEPGDYYAYRYFGGTSAATPVVTGVVSLMLGYAREGSEKYITPPNLFGLYNDDVENLLKLSADKLPIDEANPQPYNKNNALYDDRNDYVGHGRVNAYRALWYIKKGKIYHEDQAANPSNPTYQDITLAPVTIEFKEVFSSPGRMTVSPTALVRPHEVRQRLTYNAANIQNAKVWGRGSMMRESGYSWYDTASAEAGNIAKIHQGIGWCDPVIDASGSSVTNTSALMQTYVYEVLNASGVPTGEWIPCKPADVRFYYTVFDVPGDPSDISVKPRIALTNFDAGAHQQYSPYQQEQNQELPNKWSSEIMKVGTNAPNPFSDITWFTFMLTQPCFVTIEVFDMLGRKVVDMHRSLYEVGSFTTSLSASELQTGRYNVRFIATTASGISAIKTVLVSVVK